MTTIAYKDGVIAADSLIVGDYAEPGTYNKLYKVSGGYVGGAGAVPQIKLFIRWFRDQSKPKPDPALLKDFEALVVRNDGTLLYYDKILEPMDVVPPCAIGSGGGIAMGAMIAGATAVRAVEIARILDVHTGGKIHHHKVLKP